MPCRVIVQIKKKKKKKKKLASANGVAALTSRDGIL